MNRARSTPDHGASDHGSHRSYITGFVLSVILTAAAFAMVLTHAVPATLAAPAIAALALVQVLVHPAISCT